MQITVKHNGIPLGSLIKIFCVGYVIGSIIFAAVVFVLSFLISHPSVSYVESAGLLTYITGAFLGVIVFVIQAFIMALVTGIGLWLYERINSIEVFFLD
jgi:hypothetical protein